MLTPICTSYLSKTYDSHLVLSKQKVHDAYAFFGEQIKYAGNGVTTHRLRYITNCKSHAYSFEKHFKTNYLWNTD